MYQNQSQNDLLLSKPVILCIPRMETIVSNDFLREVIEKHGLGKIKKIIELQHKNNIKYKRVLVHIYLDEKSPSAIQVKERFEQKKDFKIMYNFPHFWKVVEANNIVHNRTPQSQSS